MNRSTVKGKCKVVPLSTFPGSTSAVSRCGKPEARTSGCAPGQVHRLSSQKAWAVFQSVVCAVPRKPSVKNSLSPRYTPMGPRCPSPRLPVPGVHGYPCAVYGHLQL